MGVLYPSCSTPGHVGDFKAWMAAGAAHAHSPLTLRCTTKAVPQLPVPRPHIFTHFHVPSPPSLSAIPFTFKEAEPCTAGPSWPKLHDYTLHCRRQRQRPAHRSLSGQNSGNAHHWLRMSREAEITQTETEGWTERRIREPKDGERPVRKDLKTADRQAGPATLMANLSGPVPASTAEPSPELI